MRSTSRWIRRFAGFAGLSVLAGIGTLLHADFANPTTAFDPADLIDAGMTVETAYYVDDANTVGPYGGFYELVFDMEFVVENWAPLGTRVVLVAHSHGGVWAHGAVRAVPDLTIHCQVDLDCSSYGWGTVGHDSQNAALGSDPRDDYYIDASVSYPSLASVPSQGGPLYDLEDVVFPNVMFNLDVRSGDDFPDLVSSEWYDETWNIRASATAEGLYGYYSGTSHSEVHLAGGTTLAIVRSWLRARLGV